jgi:hypothetical protein
MVSQLKAVSESALEHTISRAVLTFIDAARLPTEEINDIFDYQMRNLIVQPGGGYRFYAASAAYAGLCQSYTKPYECEKEELEFSEIFLHLDFSDAALSMTRVRLTKAVNWEAMRATVIPYLGFAMTQQGEQVLFDNVKERIRIFVQKNIPPVTLLILTGTAASDWRFIDTVKDALQDLVSVETLESFSAHVQMTSNTDLVFATAKGAAEAAKRSQEGLIKCDWIDKCKKKFGKLRNCIKVERMEL